jgi:hypothetical protein
MGKIKKDKEMHEGDDEALAPTQGFLKRPQRNQIGFLLMGEIDGVGNGDIGKAGVCVNK